jgi:FMN phosphatase YigB (HAD superfamily)
MKPPQAVVFDLGKVLVDFDYRIAARRISACSKLSPLEVVKFFDHSPLLLRYETGLMASEQFFEEMRRSTGFRGDFEEFGRLFGDIFTPIPSMIDLHAKLRQKRVPTFIFSNTNAMAVTHIRRSFPFFSEFDDYIFSYEHGAMKPDARLYEVVEKKTGRREADILYLDDRPENVAAGAARGWQVVLQEDPARSWEAVKTAGILDQN